MSSGSVTLEASIGLSSRPCPGTEELGLPVKQGFKPRLAGSCRPTVAIWCHRPFSGHRGLEDSFRLCEAAHVSPGPEVGRFRPYDRATGKPSTYRVRTLSETSRTSAAREGAATTYTASASLPDLTLFDPQRDGRAI